MSFWGFNNFYMPVMPSFMPACNPFCCGMPSMFGMQFGMSFGMPFGMPFGQMFGMFNPAGLNPFGAFRTPLVFNFSTTNIFNNSSSAGKEPAKPVDNVFGFLNSQSVTNDIKNNIKTDAKNLPALQSAGYNSQKGEKLARVIGSRSTEGGFDNYCARNVKEAIEDAGLGKYEYGHGYQVADILSRNKNFKEISAQNLNLSSLPAGCVLVYDRGAAGYSGQYGHTEITLGNGTAASGGITHNIRQGARVFVPV